MSRVTACTLGVALALTSLSCGQPLSEEDCFALLDRYTELLSGSQGKPPTAQRLLEMQGRARELAKNDPVYEFKDCSSRVSRRNFECAMRAPTADELERCLIF